MEKISFNQNWMFYSESSPNRQIIDLPHDAMLFESRQANNPSTGAGAFFAGGIYHYVKHFQALTEWKGKFVAVYFEGSYRDNTILLNGHPIASCKYGYSSFLADLTSALSFDHENVLELIADNSQMPNCRWYTGSGIYRPVWLLVGENPHIAWQGVKIHTVSISPAIIHVETSHTGGEVQIDIFKESQKIATAFGSSANITIPHARLWDDEHPFLYRCMVTLFSEGRPVDHVNINFGIRHITYTNKGLFVNGRRILLRGGCIHSDNGLLGAKSYRESEWRRIKKLKELGFNALRMSHNPCSEEILNACDYYGIYVIDEAWDMWYRHKNPCDYASDFKENFREDLIAMVKKDFSHPSVLMYSIGNEVSEPAEKDGIILARTLVDFLHSLDPTRPVTGGMNLMIIAQAAKGKGIYQNPQEEQENSKGVDMSAQTNSSLLFNMITSMVGSGMNKAANSRRVDQIVSPVLDALDIAGYNYASGRYPLEGKYHPKRLIYGSETFIPDLPKNWAMVNRYPYLIGDFLWTAWDYLGETGSGAWAYTSDGHSFQKPYPWLLADMGALDILGNPNGEAFLISAVWGKLDGPKIAVQPVNQKGTPAKSSWRCTNSIPSWSWEGCDGSPAVVEVFSDAHCVALYLNGKKLNEKKVKQYMARFHIKYAPGELMAVAYDKDHVELGRDRLVSATGPKKILIRPEKKHTSDKIHYFQIAVVGSNNIVESNDDIKIRLKVEGGTLLGFGSANPRTEESYVSGEYTTYYGQAQAIVLAEHGKEITFCIEYNGKKVKEQYVIG